MSILGLFSSMNQEAMEVDQYVQSIEDQRWQTGRNAVPIQEGRSVNSFRPLFMSTESHNEPSSMDAPMVDGLSYDIPPGHNIEYGPTGKIIPGFFRPKLANEGWDMGTEIYDSQRSILPARNTQGAFISPPNLLGRYRPS